MQQALHSTFYTRRIRLALPFALLVPAIAVGITLQKPSAATLAISISLLTAGAAVVLLNLRVVKADWVDQGLCVRRAFRPREVSWDELESVQEVWWNPDFWRPNVSVFELRVSGWRAPLLLWGRVDRVGEFRETWGRRRAAAARTAPDGRR